MADRFSEDLLDEIRNSVPITEVIASYVTWDKAKSTAGDRWACCPFHGENSPSFHAEDKKGVYHCFGCGASGDHFAFLVEQGMAFPDAVRTVAEMGGVPVPDLGGERTPARPPEQPRESREPPSASAETGTPVTVKTYDYTSRDGELLYQVRRQQIKMPDGSWARTKDGKGTWKTFRQCRPSPDGGWLWGLAAGDYIKVPGRKDWLIWKRKHADKWPDADVRFFEAVEHTIYRHPQVEIAISEGRSILLVEGEKDADTAVALGFCGTTNSSGSKHWTATHSGCFRDADVVICLDNDKAGDRADKLAMSLKGIARRVRVLDFSMHVPGFMHKGDVTDWVEKYGGTSEQLATIIAGLPDWRRPPPASKFNAISLSQIGTGIGRKHTWLVQDMVELGGSCALAGFSQSGKSFLTIKLTFAIVMGEQFFGRDVLRGMVVYQLGEGEAGFEKRLEGFMKDRGIESIEGLPLVILPKKINLFASDEDTDALILEIRDWVEYHQQPCRMVVIDTYNKATRGMNEISGQDNGKVIERVERIAAQTGATVVVIDHLSMGGRIRGHGSKTDDMTNTIRVEKDEKKVDNNGRPIRYMHLSKNKDGEAGQKVPFVLRQVVNGFDDKGRAITTCVVDPPDGSQEELERSGRLPLNQSIVLRGVRDAVDLHGIPAPEGVVGVPTGRNVVAWADFKAHMMRTMQFEATDEEGREKEFKRVVGDAGKKLQLAGYIDRDNTANVVWWTGKTDRPLPKPKEAPPLLPADVRAALDSGLPF